MPASKELGRIRVVGDPYVFERKIIFVEKKEFLMADNQSQAMPTASEQDKTKTTPVESKPIEQPAKTEPQGTPEKKS